MSEYLQKLTIEQAKDIAKEIILSKLDYFISDTKIPLLKDDYLESEYCWIFFRNNQIHGSAERAMIWDEAYAISKKGEVRLIGDFSDDPEKIQEQLQVLSNYFKNTGL